MDLALLKSERMRRGITQEQMAKCLGFKGRSNYCLMEKGKISISVDAANKIARYLGLSKEVTYKIFFDEKVQDTSTKTILAHGGDKENVKYSCEDQLQHLL